MRKPHGPIREYPHRLPRDCYRGQVTAVFTGCVEQRRPLFHDALVVQTSIDRLERSSKKHNCKVLIYCFMPDHFHLIVRGCAPDADTWKTLVDFKQLLGFWLATHRPEYRCQKDFHDHLIRADEDLVAQICYIAENPVRRGLVGTWRDYAHTGAIGSDLDAILADTATS